MNNPLKLMICCLCLLTTIPAMADSFATSQDDEKAVKISDPGWSDQNYLAKQVASIDELARQQLGVQVHQDLSDLELLQRIINGNLIEQDDTLKLQALGAVLGNVMTADIPALEWKIYEDSLGRSRALCAKGTEQCLFPITMLSRRMEKGLKPDVHQIYENAIQLMSKYLPQYPYGGGTMRKLHQ